jgi:hypothetical protein
MKGLRLVSEDIFHLNYELLCMCFDAAALLPSLSFTAYLFLWVLHSPSLLSPFCSRLYPLRFKSTSATKK